MPFLQVLSTENLGLSKKTQNSSLIPQIFKVKRGFTLIELLVVLGILAATVGSTLLFLNSILRGSNQANVTAEVRQNGQAVLDSLDRQIRNAVDAEDLDNTDHRYIRLFRSGQDPLLIKCFPTSSTNGWIGTVVSNDDPLSLADAAFTQATNIDPVSGVDISDCNLQAFPASSGTAAPPIVAITFTVNQGINAPSRQDFLANAKFAVTISLRTY